MTAVGSPEDSGAAAPDPRLAIRDMHRQDSTISTRTLARPMTAAALRTLAQR